MPERRSPTEPRTGRQVALDAIRMGRVYLDSDSYSDAIEYLKTADRPDLKAALDNDEIASLYADIARCYLGLGRHDDARSYVERIHGVVGAQETSVLAEAHVILAKIEIKSGRFRPALAAAERAYDVLRTLPDSALLAEASKALGTAHAELGSVTAARDCFIECLVTNRRIGNDAGAAGAYNNLGILAKRAGDLNRAVEYFERALSIDTRLGRPSSIARRLNNLGVALYRLSRWSEAEGHLRRALEIYSSLGATRDIVAVRSALGNISRVRRDWDAARRHFEDVLRISREAGYLRAEALAMEFLGDLENDLGNHDRALAALSEALELATKLSSSSDVVGEVLRRRAEAFLALGRLDEADGDCRRALKLCRRIGDRLEEGATLRVLAAVSYARGQVPSARVLSGRAEQLLRLTGESFESAKTALTDGVGLRENAPVDGRSLDEIEQRLSTAERLFESIGSRCWVARCRLERGRADALAGRHGRGRARGESARREFERLGDVGGQAEAGAFIEDLDRDLAAAGVEAPLRYSFFAEASLPARDGEGGPGPIHGLGMMAAEAAGADRLVLFTRGEGSSGPDELSVVTSVGRTGRRLGEVRKFVRSVVEGPGEMRPVVATRGGRHNGVIPPPTASVALLPIELEGELTYLLYADRLSEGDAGPFGAEDVEFLSAAGQMLAIAHSESLAEASSTAHRGASADGAVGLITRDPRMMRILGTVERLGDSSIPILILGESGVGKDVIARALHEGGRGEKGRLVALNSGAIPSELQESELFGHVKGAFTDADRDREGLIESASGGTLFLDEIGEMNPELQVKLLRFLQSGEYRRVGDNRVRTSSARVVSASNRDLKKEVSTGRFRRDLFYRLSAVVIEIPPLRDRRHDIPLLADHFLELYCQTEGKSIPGFSGEVMELFVSYDWSGNNVRELENEVRRCVALCADGEPIGVEHVRDELREFFEAACGCEARGSGAALSLKEEVEELEKLRIREALDENDDSKPKAAESLGLSRTGLYTKLRKYGMN